MSIEQAAMQSRYVAENAVHVECLAILTRPRTQFSLEQRQQEVAVKRSILVALLQCPVNLDLMDRNVVGPRFIEGPTLAVTLERHTQPIREVTTIPVEKASLLHKVEEHQAIEHKQGVGFTVALRRDALDGGLEDGLFAFEAAIETPHDPVCVQDLSLNLKSHNLSLFPATCDIAAIVASASRTYIFSLRMLLVVRCFGGTLEALQRIFDTGLESFRAKLFKKPAPPAWREDEVSAILESRRSRVNSCA